MSNGTMTAAPWTRVAVMLAGLIVIGVISRYTTGSVIPTDAPDALIFQNALLLIVLGSALLEYRFTKPADSVVNGLMGVLTLVPVYGLSPLWAWWWVFGYCAAVFIAATACVAASSSPSVEGWRRRLVDLTYQPSVVLGRARVLYSLVFLYAVFSFYGTQSTKTAILVVFWGVFLAIWPLRLPELVSTLRFRQPTTKSIGKVERTDEPDIVHVIIHAATDWNPESIKLLQQSDGIQRYVLPLFSQAADARVLGTGMCIADVSSPVPGLDPGYVYEVAGPRRSPEELLGAGEDSRLVGFVDKDSVMGRLRFHTWDPSECKEGMLIWSRVGKQRVYYQITEGTTEEEGLATNKHGYQVASASQLGLVNPERGFQKFPWLPAMNTPVFATPPRFGAGVMHAAPDEFQYGVVPGTELAVTGRFADLMEYHTAILGVTGSGKTELTFDLIRHAIGRDTKVICIDLTARYEERLSDLKPHNLSISPALSKELGDKLLDVETGKYGAGDEKKALKQFSDKLRADIDKYLQEFLLSTDEDRLVGVITLDEISNTKATIFITELYLTALLTFARDQPDKCPRVLLVVEEAHTVMPEASTMGLADFDSKGIVAKIAQIALQGRKYGVGLLVVAQRTATVSKTVLTQCNTIVSFSCFDDTSLRFLENFFGKTHTDAIPNLGFLQAVVFGKAINSERPIIVQIPYDERKAEIGKQTTGQESSSIPGVDVSAAEEALYTHASPSAG